MDKKPLRQGTWEGSQVLSLESCKWIRDDKELSNTSSFPIAQKLSGNAYKRVAKAVKCNTVVVY